MIENKTETGYIGLIVLLVSFGLIGLMFMALFMNRHKITATLPQGHAELQPLSASGTVPTTAYERYQADVDAAQRASELIEQGSQVPEDLGLE